MSLLPQAHNFWVFLRLSLSPLRDDTPKLGLIVGQVEAHLDLFRVGRVTANEVKWLEVLGCKFKLFLCFRIGSACFGGQVGAVLDSVILEDTCVSEGRKTKYPRFGLPFPCTLCLSE